MLKEDALQASQMTHMQTSTMPPDAASGRKASRQRREGSHTTVHPRAGWSNTREGPHTITLWTMNREAAKKKLKMN